MKYQSKHSLRPQNPARRTLLQALVPVGLLGPMVLQSTKVVAQANSMLIDDFSDGDLTSKLGSKWRGVSDRVMGGISQGLVTRDVIDGRPCLRLSGDVRLENNGGFVQAALNLAASGRSFDASAYTGVRLAVQGNGEQYSVHLRTTAVSRPWQSYRAHFTAGAAWETIDLPFQSFAPYRIQAPMDVGQLRRIGLVAIGRAFRADLAVAEVAFYR